MEDPTWMPGARGHLRIRRLHRSAIDTTEHDDPRPTYGEPVTDLPYRNHALPIEERVADLLGRMTLEEKAGQLTQYFYLGTSAPEDIDIDALPEHQRPMAHQPAMVAGAVASGAAGSVLFVKDAALANNLQRRAVQSSRLGIPLIFGFDVIHGMRTVFPVPIALAASWDPEIIAASQAVAARE